MAQRKFVNGIQTCCVRPGSRPPTESSSEVEGTNFFASFEKKGSTVFADGNRAWAKAARSRCFKFQSVSHQKMQFCRRTGARTLDAGTQCLDRCWAVLKKHVPKTVATRGACDRRANPRLDQYMCSCQFRKNCSKPLWDALGDLCKKLP